MAGDPRIRSPGVFPRRGFAFRREQDVGLHN